MESIDKLREYAEAHLKPGQVSERYMELPLDADGFCAWGVKKEVGAHFWRCECGAENYGFETCQYCGRKEAGQ